MSSQLKRHSVLMIDDEAHKPMTSAEGYLNALSDANMELRICTSASDAIVHIEKNPHPEDIVILDVMFDRGITIDAVPYTKNDVGFGILRRRLRNPKFLYCNVPVMILTNRDESDPVFQQALNEPPKFGKVQQKTKVFPPSCLIDLVIEMLLHKG